MRKCFCIILSFLIILTNMSSVFAKVTAYDDNGKYIGCICDDMCRDTTPEQVEQILERCSEIFSNAIARGAVKNPEQFYRKEVK